MNRTVLARRGIALAVIVLALGFVATPANAGTVARDAAVTEQAGCAVESSTLVWGFKESFRSYISGSIANGEWTVADGTSYETPVFGWSDGVGSYDGASGEGLISFTGSIAFTGHGGILNTTVANPVIELVDADSAVLLLDVSGTTQDGATVDQAGIEFADLDLAGATITQDGGVLTATDAPATLTAPGAEAFGTYPAGEQLDPVTFTIAVDDSCATTEPDALAPENTAGAGTDPGWLIWIAAGIVVLAAVVGVIVWRSRRA